MADCIGKTTISLVYGDDGALGDYGNIMSVDSPVNWESNATYSLGDISRSSDGDIYIATVAGVSSGTEPTWDQGLGAPTIDGTVTWNRAPDLIEYLPWTNNYDYQIGEFVKSSGGDIFYCSVTGTSDVTEPTWDSIYGNVTIDGDITWISVPIFKIYHHIDRVLGVTADVITGGEVEVDGHQLHAGDIVWADEQLLSAEMGIYRVETGPWTPIEVPIRSESFIDLGATAYNNVIGDVTRELTVDNTDLDFTTTGFYSITYSYIDSLGYETTKVRKVKVTNRSASIAPVTGYRITQYDILSGTDDELAEESASTNFDTRNGDSGYELPETPPSPLNVIYIRRDGSIVFTANQSMGNFRLTNLADPINDTDAVNLRSLNEAISSGPSTDVISGTTTKTVDSLSVSDYRTVHWLISISNPTEGKYYSSQIYFVNTGSGGEYAEYTMIGDGIGDYEISVDVVSGNIELSIENTTPHNAEVSFIKSKVA